jgi:hypothetical protein
MDKSKRHSVELADIFRMHGANYCAQYRLTPQQYQAIHAIINCRTAMLGGHVYQCDHCGALHNTYNSCRNRHCPKCQSLRTLSWLEKRRQELLPVQYFHIVFTLPHELNHLIRYNRQQLHELLFQAAWETIKTLGKDPKRLNGLMGMLAIIHTWSQNLSFHNHLHCIVPGGAFTQSLEWMPSKKGYLFPVKVMSKIFKGIYISKLRSLYNEGKLKGLDTQNIDHLLDNLMHKNWVVYSKKPFAGPEKLLDYLGRYTHKIAISNNRILNCTQDAVTFKWRDYADGGKVKIMKLSPQEFIRRFLQHLVPKGFMRIRSFGFLSNASKKKYLEMIRSALPNSLKTKDKNKQDTTDIRMIMLKLTGTDIALCPYCKKGILHRIMRIPAKFSNTIYDTS